MDIYSKKSRWKIYLALVGLIIVVISLIYTTNVASKIAKEERNNAEQWAKAVSLLGQSNEDSTFLELSFEYLFEVVQSNKNIPAVITDENGDILDFVNFDTTKVSLEKQLNYMRMNTSDSIPIAFRYHVHRKNSQLLTQLIYFPYFQLVLIAIFIIVSYFLFSWARRSEQNQVWVGLAKETAHQLGTPISGIVAWIEHLKMMSEDDEDLRDIANELRKDVNRLEKITERFSKIGAVPELKSGNILEIIERNMKYIKRRAPRRVEFEYPVSEPPIMVAFNPALFDWVLENLLRNALDAMSREGKIAARVYPTKDYINIDISDTGKGIPPSKFKTVFQPGFSTKKRGWGLGLSLTKRIIKNYHNGRIFVKESEIGKGTTFRIQLPRKHKKN